MTSRATWVQLHLNGGPRDDEYVTHWQEVLEVAVAPDMRVPLLLPSVPDVTPPVRRGRYVVRTDSNGERVPHDLTGVVEADWKGWDT